MNTNTRRPAAGLLVLALAVLLGAAGAASAQPAPGAGPGRRPFLRALRGGLAAVNLTDDQKTKIRAIFQARRDSGAELALQMRADAKSLRDLAGAASPDPAAVGAAYLKVKANRDQARAMGQSLLAEVKGVLTPDQATKLDGYFTALKQLRRFQAPPG